MFFSASSSATEAKVSLTKGFFSQAPRDIVSYLDTKGGLVRCPRCGNENSEENRFCGMCGAALLTAPVPVASAQAKGTAKRLSSSEPPEGLATPQTAPSQESRGISGPSFLGLNDHAPL